MREEEKINEKLSGESFKFRGVTQDFLKAKQLSGSHLIMVTTSVKTFQVEKNDVDAFLNEVEILPARARNLPANGPKSPMVFEFEPPKVFSDLNSSFERLLAEIDGASGDDLDKLEKKAKVLTSIGQTAVNMENAKANTIKAITGR